MRSVDLFIIIRLCISAIHPHVVPFTNTRDFSHMVHHAQNRLETGLHKKMTDVVPPGTGCLNGC